MTTEELLKNLPGPICVVGNATPLRDLGEEIDAHASVIRFNNYAIAGFEKLVGTKTTVRCVNGWSDLELRALDTECTPFRLDAPESSNLAAYRASRGTLCADVISAELDVHPLCREFGIENPSTGVALVALCELLEIPVTVACFDGFRTPHYWEKEPIKTSHPYGVGADAIARMRCTTVIGDERDQRKRLMARASSPNADRSKKRPYNVEKYLYQFQHGQGEGGGVGKTAAYRDGWDAIFGSQSATHASGEPSPKGCDMASHGPERKGSSSRGPGESRRVSPRGRRITGHSEPSDFDEQTRDKR